MQYAVGTQYTVGLDAKRSTHTEHLANMGGGDHYLVQKGQTYPGGYIVGTQYAVGMQYAVPVCAKRQLTQLGYAVGAQYAVGTQ